jgi:hypothetical protein
MTWNKEKTVSTKPVEGDIGITNAENRKKISHNTKSGNCTKTRNSDAVGIAQKRRR